jgi:hypothetical protein
MNVGDKRFIFKGCNNRHMLKFKPPKNKAHFNLFGTTNNVTSSSMLNSSITGGINTSSNASLLSNLTSNGGGNGNSLWNPSNGMGEI